MRNERKVREPPLRADRFAGIPEVEDWLLVFGTTLPSIGDGEALNWTDCAIGVVPVHDKHLACHAPSLFLTCGKPAFALP